MSTGSALTISSRMIKQHAAAASANAALTPPHASLVIRVLQQVLVRMDGMEQRLEDIAAGMGLGRARPSGTPGTLGCAAQRLIWSAPTNRDPCSAPAGAAVTCGERPLRTAGL
eukprot:CAMPEP_0182871192 /NCGR_PEP_ID=MMETSP0034_2-20130328/10978_1 /TAXON_ID=156128 /ORGANISM="Nephroselmis pyriformis, Strain CCMP717" /LENGTH=112 /DNA_ID=CAMNT_0025003729 /DNA_START=85 /DNA_END=423 /DNA_ORIENTATION=+